MNVRQLEYILAVANTGTLGRAANHVGLTQQALSKSVSRLETEYGGKLFERTSHGMVLTRLGQTVCEHAREIVASHRRLTSAIATELDLERGRIVIGLSPIAATARAGKLITDFATANPDIRIDIVSGIDRDFAKALDLGQIDFAVATHIELSDSPHLTEIIDHEIWGVTGRLDHALLSKAKSLADLKNATWMIGRNTELLQDAIEAAFHEAGLAVPRPGIMTTSVLFALSSLPRNDHLAILPQSLCRMTTGLLWKDLSKEAWKTPVYLMRRRHAHMNTIMANLVAKLAS